MRSDLYSFGNVTTGMLHGIVRHTIEKFWIIIQNLTAVDFSAAVLL